MQKLHGNGAVRGISWGEIPFDPDIIRDRNEDGYGKAELDIILLKGLSEEEKRRFVRYFVCGYTISEMAELEKISENNMSVRISRLRDKIAQNISGELVFDKKQKKFVRIDKKFPCA